MSATVAATPKIDNSPSIAETKPEPKSEDLVGTSVLPPAYLNPDQQLATSTPNMSSVAASQDDAIQSTQEAIVNTSTDTSVSDLDAANDSSSVNVNNEVEDTTTSEETATNEEAGESTGEESEENAEEESETSNDESAGDEAGNESAEEENSEQDAEQESAEDAESDAATDESASSSTGKQAQVDPDELEGIEVLVAKLPSMRPIATPYVSSPPPQAIQRRDEIIKRTGYTPDAHHAKVRQATEQVTQAARDAQRRMINRVGLIGRSTRMSIEEMAEEIKHAAQAAVAHIDHAIEKAKGGIQDAEKIRSDYLTSATMLVGTELEKHRDTVTVNIANSLREGSQAVRRLDERAQAEFTGYLDQARAGINQIPTAGKGTRIPDPPLPPGAPARRKQKPPKAPKFFKSEDTTPELTTFISAQAQTKSTGDGSNCRNYYIDRATPYQEGLTNRTQQALVKAATTKAESLDSPATRAQYLINLLGLTTPAAEHHENDESEATRKAEDALREQMTEVEYARHRAQVTIKDKSGMAVEYLDTDLRKNLTTNLWKSANKAIKSFRKQALAAEIAQLNNAAALAESYRQLVTQINQYLPAGQFLDARKLVPQLLRDRDKARALQKQHELLAKQQSEATLQQMNDAKRQQLEGLQKSAEQGAENVANVVTQTAFDMEMFVQQVTSGASTGARAAMAAGLTYADETAASIVNSIGGPTSQGVLQIQNAAVGFLNGNIGAAEQMQYSRLDGFVESMKDTSENGQLTSPMEQAKSLFEGKADRLHNHMPEPASGEEMLAGAAVAAGGALLLGPGVLVVGAVGLGSYLYNHNPSENGVITELGDVVYPGTRAIGEVFARKGYGDLEGRIRSRLDNPEQQQALNLFSASARVRGDTRRHIAERSTDFFGYNNAAREAALSGMSEAESNAMNPADVAATRQLLVRELDANQRDVSVAFLEHNREAAVAAMTRRSLDEGTRSASWGWLITAEGATRASDTARVNAVQHMDADLRRVLAIENSFAAIMTGDEISSSRARTFREFAYQTDPSRRTDRSFSDADARNAFIDYAARPHTAQLIGLGTLAGVGLQTLLGGPANPLGALALGAGLASDQITVTASTDARNYIAAMVNNDDQNADAVTRARGVYEIRQAEAGGGAPSETTQLSLARAVENPRLARLERDMNDTRLTPEERSRAAREYREEHERHLGRLQSLARDLGANPAEIATPEMAETYMRRRVGDIYARTDTVGYHLGLGGTSHRRFGEEMISHGRARLDTSVALATDGIGTHEDLLTHAYAERSTTEIAEANARWAKDHHGESMEDMLGITNNRYTSPQDLALFAASPAAWLLMRSPETSGDLAMQLEVLARGNPTNDTERLAIARLRQEQQTRGFALIADAWMSGTPEANQMTSTNSSVASAILTQALQHDPSLRDSFDINNPTGIYLADGTLDPRISGAAFNERGNFRGDRSFFTTSVGSMGQAADAYRAGVDRREAILTTFITAMALVASIAAMLIPGVNMVVAGVAIALVSGAATIAVKSGMRGARYGWEEMATDVATTAIEAATAGIGGGLGGGLGKTGFIGALGRVGARLENAVGGKIAAAIVREAVVNAVSTAASTAIQDDVWKDGLGRGFERVLNGAIRGAAVGGLSGGISTALTTGLAARTSAVQQGSAKLDMLQRFSNTFPKASEMLREGISNGVSTLVSEAAGIGIDYSQGNFHGTFLDAVKQVGIATLRESVSGALRSGITAMHKENYRALLSAAQNSPHLNQAELRLLRLVGISAGVVDYGTSLTSLAHDIAHSKDIIARMPPSMRDDMVGMDLHSLQQIAGLLDSASIDYRSGKNLDHHIEFMRGLADAAPGFDPRKLMAAIDAAVDTRRAATHEPLSTEQQQALRQRLGSELHESLKFALESLPVDALQHLTDAELKQAASMIAGGNYNTQHADQLMRAVKSRNPNMDEHLFLKNLQGAVIQSRDLQQHAFNQQKQIQRNLLTLVPAESAHIFAGLPPLDAALAQQLIRAGNEGTPHQQEMLFQAAKKSNPQLTSEEFSHFIAKAAGDVRQQRAIEANQQRVKREAGMTNVPEQLRSILSVLPEAGLIELRLRQMEGSASPAEKARLLEMAIKANPNVDLHQLSDAIDQAIATKPTARTSDAEAAELRRHLLSAVPADQQVALAHTPIMILPADEFAALTRSQKGQAVTLIIDGQPVVVIREGANPHVLREEGVHVMQARDPNWSKHIGALDERTLAHWDSLPLEQQLALYRNKITLEIDAQNHVIRSLEADLANASTPAERRALQRQLEQVRSAHENLMRRKAEVGGLSATDIGNMRAGFTEKPQWLEQPARLFNKTKETVSTADGVTPHSGDKTVHPDAAKSPEPIGDSSIDPAKIAPTHDQLIEKLSAHLKSADKSLEPLRKLDIQTLQHLVDSAGDPLIARGLLLKIISAENSAHTLGQIKELLHGLDADQRKIIIGELASIKTHAETHALVDHLHTISTQATTEQAQINIKLLLANPDVIASIRSYKKDQMTPAVLAKILQHSPNIETAKRIMNIAAGTKMPLAMAEQFASVAKSLPNETRENILAAISRKPENAESLLRALNGLVGGAVVEPGSHLSKLVEAASLLTYKQLEGIQQLTQFIKGAPEEHHLALATLLTTVTAETAFRLLDSINATKDSIGALKLTPKQQSDLMLGLMQTAMHQTQKAEFIISAKELFTLLSGHETTAHGQAVIEHLIAKLNGDMSKPNKADGSSGGELTPRDVGYDVQAAIRQLTNSKDIPKTLENFAKEIRIKGFMAEQDAWKARVNDAMQAWKKIETDHPEFADILKKATHDLTDQDRALIAEVRPWFEFVVKQHEAKFGVTLSATEKASLLRELLGNSIAKGANKLRSITNSDTLRKVMTEIRTDALGHMEEPHFADLVNQKIDELGIRAELQGRKTSDTDLLPEVHIEDLIKQKIEYEFVIEQSKKAIEEMAAKENWDDATKAAALADAESRFKAKLTEVQGEIDAFVAILKEPKFADMKLMRGFEAGTGFDQVWVKRNSEGDIVEILVSEAKGPNAGLSDTENKGFQMSAEWISKTIVDMLNSGDPSSVACAGELLHGLLNGAKISGVIAGTDVRPGHQVTIGKNQQIKATGNFAFVSESASGHYDIAEILRFLQAKR